MSNDRNQARPTDAVTRLAPSPTGALHLGNARTFLMNWALARQRRWRVLLRLEDLDGPRIKPGAAESVIDTLAWLGVDWDAGPIYQSHDPSPYTSALSRLADAGDIYPCVCTRAEIAAASLSAPNAGDHEPRYPGACRPAGAGPKAYRSDCPAGAAWRVKVSDAPLRFEDRFAGASEFNLHESIGDFVVSTKAGLPSYQLAVVVDDARQGVTEVVRGDDLLPSTPRQMWLYERLGLGPPPSYTHVPLVIGEDGRRLAKRHGDTRIDHYRAVGVRAERVIGLLAEWCGVGQRAEMPASEFRSRFEIGRAPRGSIVFTREDDRWLKG